MDTGSSGTDKSCKSMSPLELEFLGEDIEIEIVPRIQLPELELISRTWGPYVAGVTSSAPLWMALALGKRHLCELLLPKWLSPDSLKRSLKIENDNEALQPPPGPEPHGCFYYLEVAAMMLDAGAAVPNIGSTDSRYYNSDDADLDSLRGAVDHNSNRSRMGNRAGSGTDEVRSILKALEERRATKIRLIIQNKVVPSTNFIVCRNWSSMEINTYRSLITMAMERFTKLEGALQQISPNNDVVNENFINNFGDSARQGLYRDVDDANLNRNAYQ